MEPIFYSNDFVNKIKIFSDKIQIDYPDREILIPVNKIANVFRNKMLATLTIETSGGQKYTYSFTHLTNRWKIAKQASDLINKLI